MKNMVIDINIFMDFLFMRPGHEKVADVFRLCSEGKIKAFVCAHEITTLSYFLEKTIRDKRKTRKSLSGIMNRFTVCETNADLLNKALLSEIGDFEDAVIEVTAKEKKAEYILTRNIKDFKRSIVDAITPEELLAIMNQKF